MTDPSGRGSCPLCGSASYTFDVNEDGLGPATCVDCGRSFDVPWPAAEPVISLASLIEWADERLNRPQIPAAYRGAMVDLLAFVGVDPWADK